MQKLLFLIANITLLTSCASLDFVRTSWNNAVEPPATKVVVTQLAATHSYVPGTEDVPLYDGFRERTDESVIYDSTDGRIVDAEFSSTQVPADEVRRFYAQTLPQLGWNKREFQVYEREGETLKLNILRQGEETVLKFNIRPGV